MLRIDLDSIANPLVISTVCNPRGECTEHPWLAGADASDAPMATSILHRLRDFAAANKMKKVALKVIAGSLPRREILKLEKQFEEIDRDGSGAITFNELKLVIRRLGNKMPDKNLRQLMEAVDTDGNGKIDYMEFIATTIQMHKAFQEEHVRKAFEHFDKDGSGFITAEELREALASEEVPLATQEVEQIIREVDTDGNGVIDYDEFVAMMRRNN